MAEKQNNLRNLSTISQQDCNIEVGDAKPFITTSGESQLGYVRVGVFAARGALPVSDAIVTIYRPAYGSNKANTDKKNLMGFGTTNMDGQTRLFPLPAPDKSLSQDPTAQASSIYYAEIAHPDYQNMLDLPIEVFPDNRGDLQINLVPLPGK